MPRRLFSCILSVLASSLVIGLSADAYSSGPPDGRTGAPGESTCAIGCHSNFAADSGPGSVNISTPSAYTPGQTYTLTVTVSHTGQSRWGFELTALDSSGAQAGTLAKLGDSTQVSSGTVDGNPRQYIKHTSSGTFAGASDSASWQLQWTAPDPIVGPVTFYAAGNAANSNFSTSGDYIYTTSTTDVALPVTLASFVAVSAPDGVRIEWQTLSETGNLGFNVQRSETPDGPYEQVSIDLIEGAGTDANAHDYLFVDELAERGKTYYYRLEDMDFLGDKAQTDPIQITYAPSRSADGRFAITWGRLKRGVR